MKSSENNKYYKLLPGALQGLSATIVGHPFDTLKTRMQVNNYSSQCLALPWLYMRQVKNTLSAIIKMYNNE